MYKGTSRSLQRATGVQHIVAQPGYISDDSLPEVDALTLEEAMSERQQLLGELARCENEISAQKRAGRIRAARGIGFRKASICERLGIINDRIKILNRINRGDRWRQAIRDICPDQVEAIEARYRELERQADA